MMSVAKKNPLPPPDKFTWHEGDIEIIREGTGEPVLSEAELDRIIAENRLAEGRGKGKRRC